MRGVGFPASARPGSGGSEPPHPMSSAGRGAGLESPGGVAHEVTRVNASVPREEKTSQFHKNACALTGRFRPDSPQRICPPWGVWSASAGRLHYADKAENASPIASHRGSGYSPCHPWGAGDDYASCYATGSIPGAHRCHRCRTRTAEIYDTYEDCRIRRLRGSVRSSGSGPVPGGTFRVTAFPRTPRGDHSTFGVAARTIATMPARIASGRASHRSTTRAKSGLL